MALTAVSTLFPAFLLAHSPPRYGQQKAFVMDWSVFEDKGFLLVLSSMCISDLTL